MLVHCTWSIINEMLLLYPVNVTLLLYCSVIWGVNRYSIFTFGRGYFKISRYNISKPTCRTHIQICYGLILHILWNVSIFFLSIYVPWKKETKHVMIPWYVPFAFRETSKKTFSTWHISALIFYSHILSVLT